MNPTRTLYAALLAGALAAPASAQIIINGSFESGFTGWTRAEQTGSNGTFALQSGLASPVNAFAVPAPPAGANAAMTDSTAGGAHVLYQDFTIPVGPIPSANVTFSYYLNNHATAYINPGHLDWGLTSNPGGLNLNQQARVDIMTTTADPFSVAAADILQNLLQTNATTPLVTGYNSHFVDVTALFLARQGQTVRLRFAETDNVNFFNFGVDNVTVNIPAPSALALGLLSFVARRRTRQA